MSFSGTKGYLTKPKPGVMLNLLHPLSQGLVGYWLFNEGSGSKANDISGKGNHGILTNMPPNVQGSGWGGSKFGGGLGFDGEDDHVDCGNVLNFERNETFSIVAWVKTTNSGLIVGKVGADSPWRGYSLDTGASKLVGYIINDYHTNRIHIQETGTNAVTDGNWHHVVMTYNGSSTAAGVTLYVDGDELATSIVSDTLSATIINSNPFTIGRKGDGGSPTPLTGSIDYVCIYNCALLAEEVKQLYQNPFCNLMQIPIRRYSVVAPPVGAIMNQFQTVNLGADLYQGAIIA